MHGLVAGVAAAALVLKTLGKGKQDPDTELSAAEVEALISSLEKPTEKVALEFQNVKATLSRTKKKVTTKKKILKGVSGKATPGRLLAIMGSSGGGKTSLLNVLARHMPATKGMKVTGSVTINGVPIGRSKTKVAYVMQEEQFYSMLTVRETLEMAAKLRLPAGLPEEEKARYVDSLLSKLSLVKAADTRVGDAKSRGISGGERKRLSIAVELIGSPSLIFLDEPTTGLDSWQAEKVVKTLRKLADEGHTVVAVIHQPRASICGMLDDLLIMAEGEAVYSGPRRDLAKHFESVGAQYRLHADAPPAESAIDLVSVDYSSPEEEAASRARIAELAAAVRKQARRTSGTERTGGDGSSPAPRSVGGPWKQFRLLLGRSWKQVTRDKTTNRVRMTTSVMSALLFGSIYARMGRSQGAIQSRCGLLQVAVINACMTSIMKTVAIFPNESTIVRREREKKSYTVAPFFLGKLAAELPSGASFPLAFSALVYPLTGLHQSWSRFARFMGIITVESFCAASYGLLVGAFAPNADAALAIAPSTFVLQIVFGGLYVSEQTVPKVLRWLPKVSMVRWAFEALCINEFDGLTFETSQDGDAKDGTQVLRRLEFDEASVGQSVKMLARILAVNYGLTYWILRKRRPAFEEVEEEEVVEPGTPVPDK